MRAEPTEGSSPKQNKRGVRDFTSDNIQACVTVTCRMGQRA